MWLLSTDHLALVPFNDTEEVRQKSCAWATKKGYAILSHVWARDNSEQTFADIERLCRKGVTSYDDPRVSAKIRGCVRAAREQGFGWIWNDTCCIDKRSSAELEEAINSMYRWYAEAAVCLAYLQDVPNDCPIEDMDSAFRKSIWFKRGWTLQELLAPHHLIFLSANWNHLGTKVGLADLLQEITGIEADVLTFHRPLQHVSVARRMSWAASRKTTRVEDQAYSLLGIFDVSMATIYGEGSLAFRRLQVKIMKRTADHTLFAWGDTWRPTYEQISAPSRARKVDASPRLSGIEPTTPRFMQPSLENSRSLFAPSPSDFVHAGTTIITLQEVVERLREFFDIMVPSQPNVYEHVVTSSGVRCRFIVVSGTPFSLALLLCKDPSGQCLALPLWPQADDSHRISGFRAGVSFMNSLCRLIPICRSTMHALRALGWKPCTISVKLPLPARPSGTVQTVYIANIYSSALPRHDPQLEHEPRLLYFPSWLTTYLALYELEMENSPPLDMTVDPPSSLRVVHQCRHSDHAPRKTAFVIRFSQCGGNLSAVVEFPRDVRAARSYAQVAGASLPSQPTHHSRDALGSHCTHINSWKNGSRTFVDGKKTVWLSAMLWPTPESYCLEIRLVGEYFTALRKPQAAQNRVMAPQPQLGSQSLPPSPPLSTPDAGSVDSDDRDAPPPHPKRRLDDLKLPQDLMYRPLEPPTPTFFGNVHGRGPHRRCDSDNSRGPLPGYFWPPHHPLPATLEDESLYVVSSLLRYCRDRRT